MVENIYNSVINIKNGMENLIASTGIVNVPNNAGIPITPKLLKMFDPVTFPIARSAFPCFAAVNDTANSGNDVPIAIADTAIISFPMLNIVDISVTDFIVESAAVIINCRQRRKKWCQFR